MTKAVGVRSDPITIRQVAMHPLTPLQCYEEAEDLVDQPCAGFRLIWSKKGRWDCTDLKLMID